MSASAILNGMFAGGAGAGGGGPFGQGPQSSMGGQQKYSSVANSGAGSSGPMSAFGMPPQQMMNGGGLGRFSPHQQFYSSQPPQTQQQQPQSQSPHQNGMLSSQQHHGVGMNQMGQSGQQTPHLLPNNLAAHLSNPGMPMAAPPTPGSGSTGSAQNAGNAAKHQQGAVIASQSAAQQSSSSQNSIMVSPAPQPSQTHGATPSTGNKHLMLPNGQAPPPNSEEAKIYQLLAELLEPHTREAALLELSKKREMYDDLALVLWGSYGIMSSLLLEIVYVYPALSPPSLSAHASNRVCNALALLQCVASHPDTRSLFLNAHVPLFLYPFLNTTSKTRPFEYLRLTSLGVIGALVKQNDNSDVINFLLSTEIIPLCLRIMESGSELSKTVAIFIVQKILLDDMGLAYICQTYERFYAVGSVLSEMVGALVDTQAVRLLKHVVRCYLRLSDNPRAREALRACLPEPLKDGTFAALLKGDIVTKRCLTQLLSNLNERNE